MGKSNGHQTGFLARLLRNQAGNTMAIVAAAIIPLAALIGGGLDMGRSYMARARIQQACDAAALAGRRAMTTSSMTDSDKAEAKKFFDFNFPQGTFQTASFTPVIQSKPGETTTVQVTAATTIPTTVMKMFGYSTLALSVTCESRFDIGNTDVMLVLDTTGSMAYSISDGNGGTTTRLAALKQAVKDFYDTLGAGSDSTGRIRYGFMPYSSTVNVGYQLPSTALVGGRSGETWTYNSRRMTYYNNTALTTSTCYRKYNNNNCRTTLATAESDSGNTRTQSQCYNWGNTAATLSGSAPNTITKVTYTPETYNGVSPVPSSGSTARSCVRRETTTTHNSGYVAGTGWSELKLEYGDYDIPVSAYIAGSSIANPTYYVSTPNDVDGEPVPATVTWSGCIEERSTDSTITATTSTASVPDNAHDLNIDEAPTDTDTRWRPHWPEVEFTRAGAYLNDATRISGGWNACPSQSRRLASYASRSSTPAGMTSSFNAYVDGLIAVGGTYHDIGMLWGARFLSPTGIFASDNASAPNGFNISRHIVFMTDGDMSAYQSVYGAYGYQVLDGRVAATNTNDTGLTAIHNQRLQMLCNAVKGKKITVWVIGFRNQSEGDIQTPLQGCASSSNHWTMAYTAASLSQKFRDIAKNIGGLRLSQ
ncbi:pilus assembly protein TadG [Sphingobium lactosutens]|uniref:Tad domain-containing protein n=1 Tax=Sphingobium lactosutens TaxID=522773 RepID=UPI0015B83729|nr:Tad domain-containing protein [Sphingobium lactosutens]NWK98137.1 pilus assembly protein TadG [Sphingobium lactosutens]